VLKAREEKEAVLVREYLALKDTLKALVCCTVISIAALLLMPTALETDHGTRHCSYFFAQSTIVQVESNKRDNDALKVTTALLRKSPDYYTIWNVRRTILKEGFLDNA
jgi:hypothetical protein